MAEEKKTKWYTYVVAILVGWLLVTIIFGKDNPPESSPKPQKDDHVKETMVASTTITKVSEVLKTEYFDVTVNKVGLQDGSSAEYPLKKGNDIKYLIINLTVKNVDNETRFVVTGDVLIDYNGKRLKFEKTEMTFEDGWGIAGEINPLISKTANIAYKLPLEIVGAVYYKPGRSGTDNLIYLGDIAN